MQKDAQKFKALQLRNPHLYSKLNWSQNQIYPVLEQIMVPFRLPDYMILRLTSIEKIMDFIIQPIIFPIWPQIIPLPVRMQPVQHPVFQ